ncbi:very short patch repair endonuclease [Pseudomonas aeruginosa]|nr:very short patch repair endonuclease [Pseudomonas aeruginosa]MDG3785660.1 very short patch repair endonuclease [Pseudomonas aeruginosa]MDG4115891.1 very short patch repair endonuclease [Pseudomonas aeruginosa]MDG4132824.1 very short patch repair endonuclease [Pseudomonas aeruginosa]MDG4450065.1 very short patch repair endonuclease [Pseudomonas aeruginosa]
MKQVKQQNTKPELAVRSLIHRLGFRFRLHRRNLPGTPDIVFPSRRVAIFVHGCFWHGHDCKRGRPPKTRPEFWMPKLAANKARDARKSEELSALGWHVAVVWQCELDNPEALSDRLVQLLTSESAQQDCTK